MKEHAILPEKTIDKLKEDLEEIAEESKSWSPGHIASGRFWRASKKFLCCKFGHDDSEHGLEQELLGMPSDMVRRQSRKTIPNLGKSIDDSRSKMVLGDVSIKNPDERRRSSTRRFSQPSAAMSRTLQLSAAQHVQGIKPKFYDSDKSSNLSSSSNVRPKPAARKLTKKNINDSGVHNVDFQLNSRRDLELGDDDIGGDVEERVKHHNDFGQ